MRNWSAQLGDDIFRMPFSGATPEVLLQAIVFIQEVDNDHKMGVEALDCILSDFDKDDPDGSICAGMWKAVCEWDL